MTSNQPAAGGNPGLRAEAERTIAYTGAERTDGLMRLAIAGLSDEDIEAYRDTITRTLPNSKPETVEQLGRVLALIDAEIGNRGIAVCRKCHCPTVRINGKWAHAEAADAAFCELVMGGQ